MKKLVFSDMGNLQTLSLKVGELERYFPEFEKTNQSVSKSSVGWHLDHSLKVVNSVFRSLEISDVETYKWTFSFSRWWFCYVVKTFPRGKAKAPKSVLPKEVISIEDLQEQLAQTQKHIHDAGSLPFNANAKHPLFGQLNKKESIAFLGVHTEHHLRIVRDILQKKQ